MNIINDIEAVYDKGEMSYLLATYVDRNVWSLRLKESFPDRYVDNLTDFNYNKCFSVYINLSNINAGIGSKEFDDFIIQNGILYRAIIEISTLFPYCILKYSKYFIKDEIISECSDTPYCKEHLEVDRQIREIFSKYKLTLLNDNILMTEVPNKSLELREAPVSVYNCLFQDTYSYYPYLDKDNKE